MAAVSRRGVGGGVWRGGRGEGGGVLRHRGPPAWRPRVTATPLDGKPHRRRRRRRRSPLSLSPPVCLFVCVPVISEVNCVLEACAGLCGEGWVVCSGGGHSGEIRAGGGVVRSRAGGDFKVGSEWDGGGGAGVV